MTPRTAPGAQTFTTKEVALNTGPEKLSKQSTLLLRRVPLVVAARSPLVRQRRSPHPRTACPQVRHNLCPIAPLAPLRKVWARLHSLPRPPNFIQEPRKCVRRLHPRAQHVSNQPARRRPPRRARLHRRLRLQLEIGDFLLLRSLVDPHTARRLLGIHVLCHRRRRHVQPLRHPHTHQHPPRRDEPLRPAAPSARRPNMYTLHLPLIVACSVMRSDSRMGFKIAPRLTVNHLDVVHRKQIDNERRKNSADPRVEEQGP